MAITIWFVAAVIYLVFRLWYNGLGKPLTPGEIEHFTQIIKDRGAENVATVRKFMEEDDGREFIMVNLIEFNPSPVIHPETGAEVKARAMLMAYFKPFMSVMLRRAGHPVLSMAGAGGYLDAWHTPPDPGWHAAGLIRYRSRRDCLLASLANPEFDGLHKYKIAALKQNFAFPARTQLGVPRWKRITVARVDGAPAAAHRIKSCAILFAEASSSAARMSAKARRGAGRSPSGMKIPVGSSEGSTRPSTALAGR